jgi:hypothetical protein
MITGIMIGVHLLIIPVTLYFANAVLILNESPISLAKLLNYLVQQLGETSNAASGDQVEEILEAKKVRYGYTIVNQSKKWYKLELGDRVLKARKFPEGFYQ